MHTNPASTTASRAKNLKTYAAGAALAILAAVTFSACTTNTPATTWVSPNQNAQNTRYAGGRITNATVQNLGVAWTANVPAAVGFGSNAPSPLITQNLAFVQQRGGRLAGFDFYTGRPSAGATIVANALGKPPWLRAILSSPLNKLAPEISPVSTTAGTDDDAQRIVVGAAKNQVLALGAKSVKTVWQHTLSAPSGNSARVLSNMAAAGGSIFVPVANVPQADAGAAPTPLFAKVQKIAKSTGQLVSLNSENGKVNWTKSLASAPLGAATVANDIVFVTTLDGHIYAFDRDSGDQLWSSALPAGSAAPIAISDDTVIVPANVVYKKGQRAQVVAFRIGGLGTVGGAPAPKLAAQPVAPRATAAKPQAQAAKPKPAAPAKPKPAAPAGPDGKQLFTANCAGCHTLKAAGTSGTAGPNLDQLKPSLAIVLKQVTNGGASMPAFKGKLTPAEIKAIAAYVSANAGK